METVIRPDISSRTVIRSSKSNIASWINFALESAIKFPLGKNFDIHFLGEKNFGLSNSQKVTKLEPSGKFWVFHIFSVDFDKPYYNGITIRLSSQMFW